MPPLCESVELATTLTGTSGVGLGNPWVCPHMPTRRFEVRPRACRTVADDARRSTPTAAKPTVAVCCSSRTQGMPAETRSSDRARRPHWPVRHRRRGETRDSLMTAPLGQQAVRVCQQHHVPELVRRLLDHSGELGIERVAVIRRDEARSSEEPSFSARALALAGIPVRGWLRARAPRWRGRPTWGPSLTTQLTTAVLTPRTSQHPCG